MFKRLISSCVILAFILSNLQYAVAQASPAEGGDFSINQLPLPGALMEESAPFTPLALKGLIVNPQKPLEFQFIVDTGSEVKQSFKEETNKLVKYFLAGLTIPEGDLWVNLSPYEKDRITTVSLGQTELGRDLLAQDYILKQLTASLIYPEKDLGKEFWNRVYARAQKQFGTTNVPVNTFNKVWILPDQAQVFENKSAAYVTKSTLKVMLDEDYLASQKHQALEASSISSRIAREIVIPEITKEVNTGGNFAPLRQIYDAMILAKWYKQSIQNGLLDAVYTNKNKTAGVNLTDPRIKEKIYQRYLQAYQKGVFNYIKEESNGSRKYFSGGIDRIQPKRVDTDGAMSAVRAQGMVLGVTVDLAQASPSTTDAAMGGMISVLVHNDMKEEDIPKDTDVLMVPGNDDLNVFRKILDLKARGVGKYILISGGRGRLTVDLKKVADENHFHVELTNEAEMIRSIMVQLAQQNRQWNRLVQELLDPDITILEPEASFTVQNFTKAKKKLAEQGLLPVKPGHGALKILYMQKPLQQLRTKGNFESVFKDEIASKQVKGISFTVDYHPDQNTRRNIVGEFFRIVANGQNGDWVIKDSYASIPDDKWDEALAIFNSMEIGEKSSLVKELWTNVANMKLTAKKVMEGLPVAVARFARAVIDFHRTMRQQQAQDIINDPAGLLKNQLYVAYTDPDLKLIGTSQFTEDPHTQGRYIRNKKEEGVAIVYPVRQGSFLQQKLIQQEKNFIFLLSPALRAKIALVDTDNLHLTISNFSFVKDPLLRLKFLQVLKKFMDSLPVEFRKQSEAKIVGVDMFVPGTITFKVECDKNFMGHFSAALEKELRKDRDVWKAYQDAPAMFKPGNIIYHITLGYVMKHLTDGEIDELVTALRVSSTADKTIDFNLLIRKLTGLVHLVTADDDIIKLLLQPSSHTRFDAHIEALLLRYRELLGLIHYEMTENVGMGDVGAIRYQQELGQIEEDLVRLGAFPSSTSRDDIVEFLRKRDQSPKGEDIAMSIRRENMIQAMGRYRFDPVPVVTPEIYSGIRKLEGNMGPRKMSEALLRDFLTRKGIRIIVAREPASGEIVGYTFGLPQTNAPEIIMGQSPYLGGTFYGMSRQVLPGFQGQGIGSVLRMKLMHEAIKAGFPYYAFHQNDTFSKEDLNAEIQDLYHLQGRVVYLRGGLLGSENQQYVVFQLPDQATLSRPHFNGKSFQEITLSDLTSEIGWRARKVMDTPAGNKPYLTTIRLIKDLKKAGIKVGIGTAGKDAKFLLKSFGIKNEVNVIVDADVANAQSLPGKSNSGFYRAVARKMRIDPKNSVVIEDDPYNVKAAVQGGFGLVIGLVRGNDPRALKQMKQSGANLILPDIGDLSVKDIKKLLADLQGVIFDMNGVISNSAPALADGIRNAINDYLKLRADAYSLKFKALTPKEHKEYLAQWSPRNLKLFLRSRGIAIQDAAMNGGIDLNQINLKRTGKGINVQFDPAQLKALMRGNFEGFSPVIINIIQVSNLLSLLGI